MQKKRLISTLEAIIPQGNCGKNIVAVLRDGDGKIVASGRTQAGAAEMAKVELYAAKEDPVLTDGVYQLWLIVNQNGRQSFYPSFGSLYACKTWDLSESAKSKTIIESNLWKEKKASSLDNIVTIHYHCEDQDYDDIRLWVWDASGKFQHDLFDVGRDDFGLVFELDRHDYADAEKIGLLPHWSDWSKSGRKDGGDKHWEPCLGGDIYLVSGQNQLWVKPPGIIEAYIDDPNVLVARLLCKMTQPDISTNDVIITNETDAQAPLIGASSIRLLCPWGQMLGNWIEIVAAEALDVTRYSYSVRLRNFDGAVPAKPRGVLDDFSLFQTNENFGAEYSHEVTTFRLFSTVATEASVVLYDAADGDDGRATYPMRRTEKGIWKKSVMGNLEGKFYLFYIRYPSELTSKEVLDIYSTNTVNSSRRARITDFSKTNPPNWEAHKNGPSLASAVDMVIYEMHIRDFTLHASSGIKHKGLYLGVSETGSFLPGDPSIQTGIDHLSELGITHVQLMPVQDFWNNESAFEYGWGYNPVAMKSPEGVFATSINDESRIYELKQLIATLHSRGIGVILDVVFNHTDNAATFDLFAPYYYYRYWPDGTPSNRSGCGNDFCTEKPMSRHFIVDVLKHWTQEYGVDGFRFDLMELIDLETMLEAERELRQIKPDIVLYGEPWPSEASCASAKMGPPTNTATIRGTRIGAFNEDFRNALSGHPDADWFGFIQQDSSKRDAVILGLKGGFGNDKDGNWFGWASAPHNTINYLTCHDNLVLYDKLRQYKPRASEQELKNMMKLGYLLLFTAQGVPFLHSGEEFARDKKGSKNSHQDKDNINQIDWSLKKANLDLFSYTKDLIAIRKAHPVFRLRSHREIQSRLKFHATKPHLLAYALDGEGLSAETWRQAYILLNTSEKEGFEFRLPAGRWEIALNQGGTPKQPEFIESIINIGPTSGMILFQAKN